MIRDRIKGAVRKAGLRFFGMEWEASERPVDHNRGVASPAAYDPSLIPRVVEGSGDTPGPNHKTNIGRTWLAAQVASNAATVIDIRAPKELAGGYILHAMLMPGEQLKQRLDKLPSKDTRITIYDQVGGEDANALAGWLRDQGWYLARRLVGGYAEWIEHSEPIAVPEPPAGGKYAVGRMVQRKGGDRAWVQDAWAEADGPRYILWKEDGSWEGPLREDDLLG
jgi:rhodanese-related sulfurtransferase